jgi:carboxymethylenebutenolidase
MEESRGTDGELGYLARPAEGTHPGVVMIPDVWGLSDFYRTLARRLADDGFVVLALDLWRRETALRIEDPGRWIRGLDDGELLADVQAGVALLAAHPAAAGRRIGVTGFCMGGQYALLAAAGVAGLSAAVPFYGLLSHEHGLLAPAPGETLDPTRKPRSPLDAARAARCPVLGLYGEEDPFVPVEDVHALEQALAASGQPHRVILYPDAGHAFVNETRPEMYRPEAAADAWSRMVAWFHRHLGKP